MKKLIPITLLFLVPTLVYSQKKNNYLTYKTESKIIHDFCFTAKGDAIGIADNNKIIVYSTKTNELIQEFKNGHSDQIITINISKDSTLLVSGGKDSTIIIWDFVNNTIIKKLKYHKGIITSVEISSDSKYLISGDTDNKVYLYNLVEDKLDTIYKDHSDRITSVTFSPEGKLIAVASADKLINIYSLESRKLLTTLCGHKSWVREVAFSPDGKKIISCGDDSKIILWNVNGNEINEQFETKIGYNWLLSTTFYNNINNTYAIGDAGGKVKIISQYGNYKMNLRRPINKILFQPSEDSSLKIAVATYGMGILLIDAKQMQSVNN